MIGHAVLPVPNGLKMALLQPHWAVEARRARGGSRLLRDDWGERATAATCPSSIRHLEAEAEARTDSGRAMQSGFGHSLPEPPTQVVVQTMVPPSQQQGAVYSQRQGLS